ncbi:hypothetical protein [Burkholderia sp. BCC0405]|uniref:hypothetical protein n=1 Tax=Burkholderia sp. BCC0405 TaxID=2676298 RepID=UPI001ABAAC44|nr:hypothetical protein [Burkholderia sp. BCC0405]
MKPLLDASTPAGAARIARFMRDAFDGDAVLHTCPLRPDPCVGRAERAPCLRMAPERRGQPLLPFVRDEAEAARLDVGRRRGSAGTSVWPTIASLSRRSAASVASIRSRCRPVALGRLSREVSALPPSTITGGAGRTARATHGITRSAGSVFPRPHAAMFDRA